MKFFDEIALTLHFRSDIGDIADILVETGLLDFFPAHLLDGGSKEQELEFIHHHDFGDFDHDFVERHVVKIRLFLPVFA